MTPLKGAKGKPFSPLRSLYIGTVAPSVSGWWADMIAEGTHGTTVVHALQGDPERWDQWPEIRRCNPLTAVSADFRRKLLQERDKARRDSRLKARFLSYRLNVPSADETKVLLTVDEWKRVLSRPVPERAGVPIFGYDTGHNRAWSAAVALWSGGRVEAIAVAPGIPDISAAEKRDRVPAGTYRKLVENGSLQVAEGLRVPEVRDLHRAAITAFGWPARIVCDFFKFPVLQDVTAGAIPLVPRRPRWSSATEDIGALRKIVADGPLACAPCSRGLLTASLAAAMTKTEEGNVRMIKRDTHNTGRDDVAAALVLAAGSFVRSPPASPRKLRSMIAG